MTEGTPTDRRPISQTIAISRSRSRDRELPTGSPIHPTTRNAPRETASMDGWRLELPYTTLPLSLNDRRHRMVIWRAQRNLRDQVRTLTRHHRIPRLDRIHVRLEFTPTTRRTRDPDNAVATLKSAIDGLRDYPARRRNGRIADPGWTGIVADDDPTHVTWDQPVIHPAVPIRDQPAGTRLVLTIHATDPEEPHA